MAGRSGAALYAVLVCVGVALVLYPGIDLWVTRWAYRPGAPDPFPMGSLWWVVALNVGVPYMRGLVLAFMGCVALCWHLRPGMRRHMWSPHAYAYLLCAILLGPYLMVAATKITVHRPRPIHTVEFSGPHAFVPAWDRSGTCAGNCSFVSGHASAAFGVLALGYADPSATRRRRWMLFGWSFGAVVGAARVLTGVHFVSDIVWASILSWTVYALLARIWAWRGWSLRAEV